MTAWRACRRTACPSCSSRSSGRSCSTPSWVWGAFKLDGRILAELHALWQARQCRDEYLGTLVNAWIEAGGRAVGVRAGSAYVDTGTLHGYRAAMALLGGQEPGEEAAGRRLSLGGPGAQAVV